MDVALLFPSKYLKSAEFQGKDVTLTIAGIAIEDLADDRGGTKAKGVVTFRETKKAWVLNRTNAECAKALFGRETDRWVGKRITLYPAPFTDPFTGEVGTAIRVRGSPDIEKDMTAEVHLPRKKPTRMHLKKTAAKGNSPAPAPAPSAPEPGSDDASFPGVDA